MKPWLVTLALFSSSLVGCVLPGPHAVHGEVHGPHVSAHAWVYYPHEDVYYCTAHDHAWLYVDGGWRRSEVVPSGLTTYVRLSTHLAHPYQHGHAWVYYEGPGAYYCTVHRRAWVYSGSEWTFRVGWRPQVEFGTGVRLELGVGRPHLHHPGGHAHGRGLHLRAKSVPASGPRGASGAARRGHLPSQPAPGGPAPRGPKTLGPGPKAQAPGSKPKGHGPKAKGHGGGRGH